MQAHAGLAHVPLFAPNVARFYRGMLVELPLQLWALPGRPTARDLHAAWFNLATELAHAGDTAGAIQAYQAALAANPGRVVETLSVGLKRPRNQLTTREEPQFLALRHRLFQLLVHD